MTVIFVVGDEEDGKNMFPLQRDMFFAHCSFISDEIIVS
jgi:hypothetical protein